MENSVRRTVLPLSICFVVSGFYTLDVTSTKCRRIVISYCCLLVIIFITYLVLFTVIKLQVSQYTFDVVINAIAEIIRTTMLTYYCIKFIVQKDAITGIFKHINYADNCLKRIGVKVPHTKEQTQCAIYTVLIILISTIHTIATLKWRRSYRDEMFTATYSAYYIPAKLMVVHSTATLQTYAVFLLYIVQERTLYFLRALDKIKEIFAREFAWDSDLTVSVVDTLREDTSATRLEKYFTSIQKIDTCICEAFRLINNFYKDYFVLHAIFYVLKTSRLLFLSVVQRIPLYYVGFLSWYTLFVISSSAFCANIRFQLQTVQILRNKFCWLSKFKTFEPADVYVRKWFIQETHKDRIFDCGYFEIDLNILAILFNFVVLLLFTMVPCTVHDAV